MKMYVINGTDGFFMEEGGVVYMGIADTKENAKELIKKIKKHLKDVEDFEYTKYSIEEIEVNEMFEWVKDY